MQGQLHPQRSTETPAVVAFQHYARFTSIDPDENRRRFYCISWQPSLFGRGLLVRTWGRIGTHGTVRAAAFPDRQSAHATVERLIHQRSRRRYEPHTPGHEARYTAVMTTPIRQQLHDQAEALYEQYGKPLEGTHAGQYVVIAPDGRTVIAPTLVAAAQAAAATLGRGNFAFKIGERAVATWK